MSEKPACSIDYTRLFSLPVGIAPEKLDDTKRMQYASALRIGAELQNSTLNAYHSQSAVKPNLVTPFIYADGSGDEVLVPPENQLPTEYTGPGFDLTDHTNDVVRASRTFSPPDIGPGLSLQQVAAKIEEKTFRDKVARDVSPLAMPRTAHDTLRFYWPSVPDPGFQDVLGLDLTGVLPAAGLMPPQFPEYLLETWITATTTELGEVDRLLLRSPVLGQFRFEIYYHYRKRGDSLRIIGPSNSGRLIVKSMLHTHESRRSRTSLYQPVLFVFEHVDRSSVIPHIYRHLVFQLAQFGTIVDQYLSAESDEPRIAITRSKKVLFEAIKNGIHRLLKGWLAFLTTLHPTAEDQTVKAALPVEWWRLLGKARISELKLKEIVIQIINETVWQEALLRFVRDYYAPLLSGYSWLEVLNQHAAGLKFPLPEDELPTSADDLDQVKNLEAVQDTSSTWIACYAGAPLGKPSPAYDETAPPAGAVSYPATTLTAYELEAAHLANRTTSMFTGIAGLAALLGPTSGQAMDLSPFTPKHRGHVSMNYIIDIKVEVKKQEDIENNLYTLVDWLIELLQGLNVFRDEPSVVDLLSYVDLATGNGHPLYAPLRVDEYLRAKSLRRQLDILDNIKVGTKSLEQTNLDWWKKGNWGLGIGKGILPLENVLVSGNTEEHWVNDDGGSFESNPPGPSNPYQKKNTMFPKSGTTRILKGIVAVDKGHILRPSGFDEFDIYSAYLAQSRMLNPITNKNDLPMPVILALMEREGLRFFAFLNRLVNNTTRRNKTISWSPWDGNDQRPSNADDYTNKRLARFFWFGWPYGLDRMILKPVSKYKTDDEFDTELNSLLTDGILKTMAPGEHMRKYIEDRIEANWISAGGGIGRPVIWKRARRAHWAFISLMAGWYQHVQKSIHEQSNEYKREWDYQNHPGVDWLLSDVIDLAGEDLGKTVLPDDEKWRHFITYYSFIYLGYNTQGAAIRPLNRAGESWSAYIKRAEGDPARPATRSLRDHLFFFRERRRLAIHNMVRFGISLDSYMRLDCMHELTPDDFSGAMPYETYIARPDNWGS